ncbi:MAG TPA: N-6 DNA methylase [Allosphingosinicella sp.]|nr:N-6 DNA methylase [Allosphingosinicella sp.]
MSEPEIVLQIDLGFEILLDTVNSFETAILTPKPGGPDPILYFYEDFLGIFDADAKQRYGVYYTPIQVVRYMVGALDRALRDNLGTEGLRDDQVTILDPAVGTGTFLLGIAERVKGDAAAVAGPGPRCPHFANSPAECLGSSCSSALMLSLTIGCTIH